MIEIYEYTGIDHI